jgi:hypothetical protein
MTRRQSGKVYVPAALCLGWPNAAPSMAVDWADGGGSWNEPSPGSISFAACAFAMKSEPTSTKRSCLLHVP